MGFDNWRIFAEFARPPLTSVDMNLEQLGRLAARELFRALDGESASGVEHLPCRLVTRDSTAPVG